MSITKWRVASSAVALSAMMLLAMGVQAGPAEVRQFDAGLADVLEQELAMEAPVDRSSSPGVQETGSCSKDVFMLRPRGGLVMTVSSYYSTDVRNDESYFVCSTFERKKYLAASFESFDGDYYNTPFRMKISEVHSDSGAAKRVPGWFLTVQEDNAGDSKYDGYLRLSADADPKRAAWWIIRTVNGTDFLTVAYAPAAPSIVFEDLWTLSIPPGSRRDRLTSYFAVGPTKDNDLSRAVSFQRTPV